MHLCSACLKFCFVDTVILVKQGFPILPTLEKRFQIVSSNVGISMNIWGIFGHLNGLSKDEYKERLDRNRRISDGRNSFTFTSYKYMVASRVYVCMGSIKTLYESYKMSGYNLHIFLPYSTTTNLTSYVDFQFIYHTPFLYQSTFSLFPKHIDICWKSLGGIPF